MVSAWRIVKAKYAAHAFDGEGARRSGGRWNTPGNAVIYTSAHASLAVLEMVANLGTTSLLPPYVLIECRIPERMIVRLQRALLPSNWQTFPAPPEVQALGDKWLKLRSSTVLEVPSVLVPIESNYLLNPNHRDFGRIEVGRPQTFPIDKRLLT